MLSMLVRKAIQDPDLYPVLSAGLQEMVPFNGPHQPKVLLVTDEVIEVEAPHMRVNCNHFGEIHAAMSFTIAELAAAIRLLAAYDDRQHDIVFRRFERGIFPNPSVGAVTARCCVKTEDIRTQLLQSGRTIEQGCRLLIDVKLHDSKQTLVSDWSLEWHVKARRESA